MCSALQPIDRCVDETGHVIILGKFENNKKYKEQILKEIIAAISAMLNTNGGKVVIHIEIDPKFPVEGSPFSHVSLVIRILEQSITSVIGLNQMVGKISFKEDEKIIIIIIKKTNSLITANYNLYLPSQKQVVQVPPLAPPENIVCDIINRKIVAEPVKPHSHYQKFIEGKYCGFRENEISQLKNLEAKQSKRTRIADRMTGKGNKFSCYVSAFANYRGGHIYYGISDVDGVVKGEEISNDDISDITKKVEKAINKIIWPETTGKPTKGKHWEIFFEPVLDKNSKPIPSTFVIVIYIAPCLGGVFVEEPECFEMVEGKVKMMSFDSWKRRILHPLWPRVGGKIPPSAQRIKWSSASARKTFAVVSEKLGQLICHGRWDVLYQECKRLLRKSESGEMKLLVLWQKAKAHYRQGKFIKALEHLDDYEKMLPKIQNRLFFEVMKMQLYAALHRAKGDLEKHEEFLTGALENSELIEPGLVTAIVYTFAGSVTDLIHLFDLTESFSPDILSMRALEHVQRVVDFPNDFHPDKEQKAHINLASFYLGFNIRGQLMKKNVDMSDLQKAMASIMAVQQSAVERNPLSSYYEVQLNLICSFYNYRQSQVNPYEKTRFLRIAFNYAKKAERLARDCKFIEMLEWSKTNVALCTEELVVTKLEEMKIKAPGFIDYYSTLPKTAF